jgi:hypothetical protein
MTRCALPVNPNKLVKATLIGGSSKVYDVLYVVAKHASTNQATCSQFHHRRYTEGVTSQQSTVAPLRVTPAWVAKLRRIARITDKACVESQ